MKHKFGSLRKKIRFRLDWTIGPKNNDPTEKYEIKTNDAIKELFGEEPPLSLDTQTKKHEMAGMCVEIG